MRSELVVQTALDENPEIVTVLRVAALARDTEARELPREIGVATEVVSIPLNPQCAV